MQLTKKEQLWGLVYLALSLLIIPTLLPFSVQLLFPAAAGAALNFACFLCNFICTTVIFRRHLAAHAKLLITSPRLNAVVTLLGLCAYFALNRLVSAVIMAFLPEFVNINDSSVITLFSQDFYLMAVGTVFLVPVAEELLYRCLIFGSFLKKSPALAYLVSVPLFCAIHVLPYWGQHDLTVLLGCFLQYIPAGICLGWAYHKTGNIFAPILIHAIINALGIAAVR